MPHFHSQWGKSSFKVEDKLHVLKTFGISFYFLSGSYATDPTECLTIDVVKLSC